MYVYDMDGKLLWQKDLGDKTMRNQFGEGSTPVLHGNRLVIVWDHQGGSRSSSRSMPTTGKELWRAERATRSTPGRRRSSSSTTAARRCRRRDEQAAQLRPRNRQDRVGKPGHDDERDSVAGGRPTAWCS